MKGIASIISHLFLQSAGIGGCAHLVHFLGSDTLCALMTAKMYYGCDMAGFSVPAAEHRYVNTFNSNNAIRWYEYYYN